MAKELEIEFKNMLTKEEYESLLAAFGAGAEHIATQTNHYFDTADSRLKHAKCALRIREQDGRFECTLKTPAKEGNYEWTDDITAGQANALQGGGAIEAPTVAEALGTLHVSWEELRPIGSLTTHRAEFPYEGGLLAIDHSEYLGTEDYELEYEVQDSAEGQRRFHELLQAQRIPLRPAMKKIARLARKAANGGSADDGLEA